MDLGISQYKNLSDFSLFTGEFKFNEISLFKSSLHREYMNNRYGQGHYFIGNLEMVNLNIEINEIR